MPKYYAMCDVIHGVDEGWLGDYRDTEWEAQRDADQHNQKFTPPHEAGVLPIG